MDGQGPQNPQATVCKWECRFKLPTLVRHLEADGDCSQRTMRRVLSSCDSTAHHRCPRRVSTEEADIAQVSEEVSTLVLTPRLGEMPIARPSSSSQSLPHVDASASHSTATLQHFLVGPLFSSPSPLQNLQDQPSHSSQPSRL